jgi:hypothetical protein
MVYFRGFIARLGCFLGLSVRIRAQNEQKKKKNEEKRRKVTRNFQWFADFQRFLIRAKQESRGPIIGLCPLSLAGKLKYVYPHDDT